MSPEKQLTASSSPFSQQKQNPRLHHHWLPCVFINRITHCILWLWIIPFQREIIAILEQIVVSSKNWEEGAGFACILPPPHTHIHMAFQLPIPTTWDGVYYNQLIYIDSWPQIILCISEHYKFWQKHIPVSIIAYHVLLLPLKIFPPC